MAGALTAYLEKEAKSLAEKMDHADMKKSERDRNRSAAGSYTAGSEAAKGAIRGGIGGAGSGARTGAALGGLAGGAGGLMAGRGLKDRLSKGVMGASIGAGLGGAGGMALGAPVGAAAGGISGGISGHKAGLRAERRAEKVEKQYKKEKKASLFDYIDKEAERSRDLHQFARDRKTQATLKSIGDAGKRGVEAAASRQGAQRMIGGMAAGGLAAYGAGKLYKRMTKKPEAETSKAASLTAYSQLFDSVVEGELGKEASAALYGICVHYDTLLDNRVVLTKTAGYSSSTPTEELEEDSRKRRLAELLRKREHSGTATGSASPNPPKGA